MKKKKFRRDTRFFNDVFFLKKSTATRCKNCQGTPNFGIHGKLDCIVKHGGNLWHKEGK